MPVRLVALILVVLVAAALTVWLLTLGGAGAMVLALPAFLIAAAALRVWRR